jgi:GTPase SAR1 family protein
MREQFMRNGEGFVLMYSITSYHSFEQVQKLHDQIARVKDLDSFPVVLVGNKCDLEQDRQVPASGIAIYISIYALTYLTLINIFYQ